MGSTLIEGRRFKQTLFAPQLLAKLVSAKLAGPAIRILLIFCAS